MDAEELLAKYREVVSSNKEEIVEDYRRIEKEVEESQWSLDKADDQ